MTERGAFVLRVKPDRIDDYVEAHRAVWPDMLQALRDAGIRNYSIFRDGTQVFGYFEADDLDAGGGSPGGAGGEHAVAGRDGRAARGTRAGEGAPASRRSSGSTSYARVMRRVNIGEPVFEYDDGDPDGFRAGMFRFGKLLDARQLGTTVYELPPGQSICPYHYEYGEEEWLLVLSGRPTLRHPEGSDELETWDVVCFPSGPAGAHAIHNDTDETVRVLMYSSLTNPAVTVYPDSDKIAVWPGNADDNLIVHRASGVDYWSGEAGR